jgi:hypothetical protein
MGIRIDALDATATPSRDHEVPAMNDGATVRLSVDQMLGLIEASDVQAGVAAATSDDTFADTDELSYLSGSTLKRGTLTGLLASIFKTARTIANAQFASATFKLFNAAGTPRALTFNTTALSADRVGTFPDADVDFGNVGPRLGVGQTWQNLTGSRVVSTWYQNTTGRPIMVSIAAISASTRAVQISPDGGATIYEIGRVGTASGGNQFIVPAGDSYRVDGAITAGYTWLELR